LLPLLLGDAVVDQGDVVPVIGSSALTFSLWLS
jgi:hypothetical protein